MGGSEEARLKRTFLGRLRPNRVLTAMVRPDLAHAAGDDARRAGGGDRRRGPRAAGAPRLPAGLVVSRRRRRMGRDHRDGAGARARRGGGRHAHRAARSCTASSPTMRASPATISPCSWCGTSSGAGIIGSAARSPRRACSRAMTCPSASIPARACASPRSSTTPRSGRCGDPQGFWARRLTILAT